MTRSERLLFGERLYKQRTALALTQEFVSQEAGITLRFYQMVERGEKSVSLDTLVRLAGVLSISIDYLLFGDLPTPLENPIAKMLRELSPDQRADAEEILKLYAKACEGQRKPCGAVFS